MGIDLASFKNSRLYPRDAGTDGTTVQGVSPTNAGPVAQLLPQDDNRTVATIRNLHATDTLMVAWATTGVPPTLPFILANGFPLKAGEAFDFKNTQALYCASSTANAIPYAIEKEVG